MRNGKRPPKKKKGRRPKKKNIKKKLKTTLQKEMEDNPPKMKNGRRPQNFFFKNADDIQKNQLDSSLIKGLTFPGIGSAL
jgi:hypothetical protein